MTTKHINRNCIKESAKLLFKKRYTKHKKSFNAEKNKNDTKLSTEYWKLANNKLHPQISWSIKGNYKSYNPNSKRCSLCLHEKLEIVDDPKEILLNKRSEVISQCHHRNKYKLNTLVCNKKDRASQNNGSTKLQVYRKYMLWRFSKFLEVLRGRVYP